MNEHNRTVIEQFTKQAVPFSKAEGHKTAIHQMLEMANVSENDNVLDVACGPGLVASAFAPHVHWITGIDITPAMITRARELETEHGHKNMSWKVGNVEPLPYLDGMFSAVITRYSFHHFTDPRSVYKEMKRVCAMGGTITVADVVIPEQKREAYDRVEKLKDPSHVSALTLHEFRRMAQDLNLRDVRTDFYGIDMELESQMRNFPITPETAEEIRRIYAEDIGKNELGMNAHWVGNEIHFTYPVLILGGRKFW